MSTSAAIERSLECELGDSDWAPTTPQTNSNTTGPPTDPANCVNNSSIIQPSSAPAPLYTPYYCEENTHNLLRALDSGAYTHPPPARTFALFISNPGQHCLLFNQKAGRPSAEWGSYVVWDYHVVAVGVFERCGGRPDVMVFDRDSLLGGVVPLRDYVRRTFEPPMSAQGIAIDPEFRSRFRVVPSDTFFANFASDRSHMLVPPGPSYFPQIPPELRYQQPPPPHPALVGDAAMARGERNNLFSHFLDVRLPAEAVESPRPSPEAGLYGEVVAGPEELLEWEW